MFFANDGLSAFDVYKSVFTSSTPTDPIAPISYCVGHGIATTNTISDQPCATAIVTAATLGSKIAGAQGITTLPPHYPTSAAFNAAVNCIDAAAEVVTHDANGTPRPQFGACDLGAPTVCGRMVELVHAKRVKIATFTRPTPSRRQARVYLFVAEGSDNVEKPYTETR